MHRQSAGQIWLNKKVQNSGRKRVRKATLFLLNDDGPAAVLPLRPAAALCVKMEKKANRKKNRRRSDKTRAILFYNGKTGRNMQVAIGVFVLGANAIETAVIFLRDLTISKAPAPPTHTHPLPQSETVCPFSFVCVFFFFCLATWFAFAAAAASAAGQSALISN